jgi:cell division protein FtsQ
MVIVGGALAAAIVILYTPWLPFFDLREIVVTGNRHTTTETIERVAGFCKGDNLLRLPVRRASQALLDLPWIKEVTIHRSYLHEVRIVVEERIPIALTPCPNGDGQLQLVIAEGGVIVQKVSDCPSLTTATGIVLTGDSPGARLNDARVIQALEYLHRRALNDGAFYLADFSNPSCVLLRHTTGLEVALGPVQDIQSRIDALVALLETLDPKEYQHIDLRFGEEAVLVPRKVVNR